MDVRQLRQTLEALVEVYREGGAAKTANQISDLVAVLEPHEGKTITALTDELKRAASTDPIVDSPVRRSTKDADLALAEPHATALLSAGTDTEQFDRAMANMKADKAVRIAEVAEIANRYKNAPLGGVYRYTFDSRKKAEDFIVDTFTARAQAESKFTVIDRMTKWATG
jgi:hypothetical protein